MIVDVALCIRYTQRARTLDGEAYAGRNPIQKELFFKYCLHVLYSRCET